MVTALLLIAIFSSAYSNTQFLSPNLRLVIDEASKEDYSTARDESDSFESKDINVQSALKICTRERYCCPEDTECCHVEDLSDSEKLVGFISRGLCCKNSRALPGWPC